MGWPQCRRTCGKCGKYYGDPLRVYIYKTGFQNIHHAYLLSKNCLIIDCNNDGDCIGNSDTCSSHSCRCGSTDKCSGNTDTCVMGECKCGENEECSGTTDTCVLGECKCGENEECSETETCANGECLGI